MSETHSTITLSNSLANDPRTHLEAWLEDVETQARHQCPQHDITGALNLVVCRESRKLTGQLQRAIGTGIVLRLVELTRSMRNQQLMNKSLR